jgi:preprotein translocase subunit SecG
MYIIIIIIIIVIVVIRQSSFCNGNKSSFKLGSTDFDSGIGLTD